MNLKIFTEKLNFHSNNPIYALQNEFIRPNKLILNHMFAKPRMVLIKKNGNFLITTIFLLEKQGSGTDKR